MPHSIVYAQFNPAVSAYWLSSSGRQAAARIPCPPFWAVQFSLNEESEEGTNAGALICTISSRPSNIPLPNASFTLGPKYAVDTGQLSADTGDSSSELMVHPPISCHSSSLHQPLYAHTVPSFVVMGWQNIPNYATYSLHRLHIDSFRRFQSAADHNRLSIYDVWEKYRGALVAARLPPAYTQQASDGNSTWPSYNLPDPAYMFSEFHNPHAYYLDFLPAHPNAPLPISDCPIPFYEQVALYTQICKDYRWNGAERTIAWVRATRADYRSFRLKDRIMPSMTRADAKRIPTEELYQNDADFRAQLTAVMSTAAKPFDSTEPISYNSDEDTADSESWGSSYVSVWELPFAFPRIAARFPRVLLPHTPPVVVLDTFGVILDREGAISSALSPWLPLVGRRPKDVAQAVKLYIEIETLAARNSCTSAMSLPSIVHTALTTLAARLAMSPAARPAFLADAAAMILRPQPHRDAVRAVDQLVQRGCTVVGLVPVSASTLAALRPALPPRLRAAVQFFPAPIPLHAPVPAAFFARLFAWCKPDLQLPPGCGAEAVVVASGGVGRVLAQALLGGHPAVLVKQPGGVECDVEFVVGNDDSTPHPSAVVQGLDGLCHALAI